MSFFLVLDKYVKRDAQYAIESFGLPILPTNLVRCLANKEMTCQNKGVVQVQSMSSHLNMSDDMLR